MTRNTSTIPPLPQPDPTPVRPEPVEGFPAYLFVGKHEHLIQHTLTFLQTKLCPFNGCAICTTCIQINTQQHHAITWLAPQKNYTLDQLEIIFNTITFALDPDDHHFFVIQQADLLTPACGNSLLKSLEEPPAGYHFILLAERPDQLLPTIRSRCIIDSFYAEQEAKVTSELFTCFTRIQSTNAADFLKILEQSKITEQESIDLLDQLLTYWLTQSKNLIFQNNTLDPETTRIIDILKNSYTQLPMPGSSKLFWKNIFLQLQ